jgi:ribulose-phosphate 3-epimerase
MVKISASILCADFSQLAREIKRLERAKVDLIHFDVMDGQFVPNLTFGPDLIKSVRDKTKIPFDVHLMIVNPENFIDKFISAGADYLTVHSEATLHLQRTISYIKSKGIKAGVSLNPSTPLCFIENILEDLDLVLIMSVNPGFAGQKFIPNVIQKIRDLKEKIIQKKLNVEIEVDGGINRDTSKEVVLAGADILVAASAIFNCKEGLKKGVEYLRNS